MIRFESNAHDRWLLHVLGVDMNSGPGAAWLWQRTQRHLGKGLDLMERRRREIKEAAVMSRLRSDLDLVAARRKAKETDGRVSTHL